MREFENFTKSSFTSIDLSDPANEQLDNESVMADGNGIQCIIYTV